MSINNVETEAKFIIPNSAIFADLQRITRLGEFELMPIGTRLVVDRYLDTAGQHMRRAGFACRIRTIREKKILTLKSLTPAAGTVHRRQEIELEIETEAPQTWAKSEAKDVVLDIAGAAPLETLFVIHQSRHKFDVLLKKQSVIEFSLDEVCFNDPEIVDYRGLEAELTGTGSEAELVRFIEALQANWSLPPDNLSKFERGLANAAEQ